MTNISYLAEGNSATQNPLDSPIGPLLPMSYDIVWSLIPFLLILFVFWKFVLPRFQAVLKERENQIEGGIARAEAAQSEVKAALENYNAQLAEARTEASQIRDDARSQGQKIISDMKDQATQESDRIVESGEKQLLAQRDAVVTQLRQELGQNSIALAERLLGTDLGSETKSSSSIDKFLSELDDVEASGK